MLSSSMGELRTLRTASYTHLGAPRHRGQGRIHRHKGVCIDSLFTPSRLRVRPKIVGAHRWHLDCFILLSGQNSVMPLASSCVFNKSKNDSTGGSSQPHADGLINCRNKQTAVPSLADKVRTVASFSYAPVLVYRVIFIGWICLHSIEPTPTRT